MSEYTESGIISFQQKQSFDYHISLTDSNNYEILLLDLDVTNLKFDLVGLAINKLFEENDSLRTIFTQVNGETFQNVLIFKPNINYYDVVSKVDTNYSDAEVDKMLSEMRIKMGLSEKTLLVRCALVQFKHNIVRCIFFIHHIIADLWSVLIVKKEFYNIYKNLTDGLSIYTLPAVKKYNMIDYAIEQKTAFDRNKSSVISYWQKKLTPVLTNEQTGVTNLLGQKDERFNSSVSSINDRLDAGDCGFIVSKIEGKLYSSIYKILKESNTGFMALFNLLFSLLPSHSKINRHVLIASPVNNRLSSNLKSAIGLCGGSIYTCLDITFELNISQLLKQAYIDILKSFKHAITEHQVFQLDGRSLREKTDLFLNITSNDLENKIPDHYHTHPKEAFEGKRIYYKLQCSVHEQSDHICLIWGFNKEFYTKGQVETMIKALFNLIEIFESGLEKPLSTSLDLINSLK